MELSKQQPWKININAKYDNFYIKVRAGNTKPTSKFTKFFKFFLFLKFQESLLHDNTESSKISILKKPKTSLKSKFLKVFRIFKISPAKKRPIDAQKTPFLENVPERKTPSDKEPIGVEAVSVALLLKSIFQNDHKGMVVHGRSVLSFVVLFLKNYLAIKPKTLMVFLTIALVVYALMFLPLDKYIYHGNADYYVSQLLWKGWNYVVTSSGSLYRHFQVVLSRFFQIVGANLWPKYILNYPGKW